MAAGLLVNPKVLARMTEDVEVVSSAFLQLPEFITWDEMKAELRPLQDTIALLKLDIRRMSQFVRGELCTVSGGERGRGEREKEVV